MKLCLIGDAKNIHIRRRAEFFARVGYDVHVISFSNYDIPKTKVHLLHSVLPMKLKYFGVIFSALNKIDCIQPDVIDVHYLTGFGFIGSFIPKKYPVVATAWGSDVLVSTYRSFFLKHVVQRISTRADKIISVSKQITQRLKELDVDQKKIETFPMGVDLQKFQCQKFFTKQEKKLPFTVISTRWLEPIYNIGLLIDAIALVVEKNKNFHFIIVGDGSLRSKYEQLIGEKKIKEYVTFTGKVDHTQLIKFLADADVYVTTSLSDGTSESLLEAMASGLFPIATNIPANSSWIRHGENGVLIPINDPHKLAEYFLIAYEDEKLRKRAVEENLKIIVEKGNLHKNMDRLSGIYESLVR